jgi:hypothetical protein
MEISKTLDLTNSLGEKIKNAYKKDIENSIDELFQKFDIFKRNTDKLIDKDDLINIFLKPFDIVYCSAATKSNKRCKYKTVNNSNYCSRHLRESHNLKDIIHYPNFKLMENKENTNEINDFFLIKNTENNEIENSNLKKILIQDSFYMIDDKWIYNISSYYDKNSYEKVGYIDGEEYILTNDPFILDIIGE